DAGPCCRTSLATPPRLTGPGVRSSAGGRGACESGSARCRPALARSGGSVGSSRGGLDEDDRLRGNPAHRMVAESRTPHPIHVPEVPTIEYHRLLQHLLHPVEIRATIRLPLGEHDQRVGARAAVVVVVAKLELPGLEQVPEVSPRLAMSLRIMGTHRSAPLAEPADHREAGCLPHVVRLRLERQTPDCKRPTREIVTVPA